MFSCILPPYSRLGAKKFLPYSRLAILQDSLFLLWSRLYGKRYPILDQNSLISISCPRLNCSKTLPFTAAHTYIPYIWEYPRRDFCSTSFQLIQPKSFRPAATVLQHVIFDLPGLLLPSGVHVRATHSFCLSLSSRRDRSISIA